MSINKKTYFLCFIVILILFSWVLSNDKYKPLSLLGIKSEGGIKVISFFKTYGKDKSFTYSLEHNYKGYEILKRRIGFFKISYEDEGFLEEYLYIVESFKDFFPNETFKKEEYPYYYRYSEDNFNTYWLPNLNNHKSYLFIWEK